MIVYDEVELIFGTKPKLASSDCMSLDPGVWNHLKLNWCSVTHLDLFPGLEVMMSNWIHKFYVFLEPFQFIGTTHIYKWRSGLSEFILYCKEIQSSVTSIQNILYRLNLWYTRDRNYDQSKPKTKYNNLEAVLRHQFLPVLTQCPDRKNTPVRRVTDHTVPVEYAHDFLHTVRVNINTSAKPALWPWQKTR